MQITKLFSVTSVFAKIYQPEVLESAFSVVSKLNCSSGIERSDTCIDLNEPEVDCTNGRTRSVKTKKKKNSQRSVSGVEGQRKPVYSY